MGGQPMMAASAQTAGRAKKFKLIGVGIIAAAVLALGVGGYFVYGALMGLKLKEYRGDGYSLLVPADYKEEEEGSTIIFKEDDDEDSASELRVAGESFPRTVTDEEIDTVVESFKQGIEQGIGEFSGENEIKNVQITDTTHKGNKAVKITADAVKDGKNVGKVVMVFAFTHEGYYGLALIVHHQDTGLDKKVDAIIESFEIEE